LEYERPVGRFLAQMVSSHALAEDLLQETFLVALREIDSCPAGAERAWLYAIARHRALHALRGLRRGRDALARLGAQLDKRSGTRETEAEALAIRDLLVRTIAPADRSLFVLRYVHGFTAVELADMTGMQADAIRKRLQRAAERMAEAHRQLNALTHADLEADHA